MVGEHAKIASKVCLSAGYWLELWTGSMVKLGKVWRCMENDFNPGLVTVGLKSILEVVDGIAVLKFLSYDLAEESPSLRMSFDFNYVGALLHPQKLCGQPV